MEEPVADIVIFRRFSDGEVIALFPALAGDPSGELCLCYSHIGQHGAADYRAVVQATSAATSGQYARLAAELRACGYVLDVRRRASARQRALRRLNAADYRESYRREKP